MTDEMAEREIGKVDKEVYLAWADAAGGAWIIVPLLLLIFAAGEFTKVLANWWLTYWSHAATPDSASQLHFLMIYSLINLLAILVEFLRMVAVVLLGLKASASVSWSQYNKTFPLGELTHISFSIHTHFSVI